MKRIAFLILALCTAACATTPRADRDWYPYLARTAHVEMDEAGFSLRPVTDWSYSASTDTDETYGEAAYRFEQLRNVWFVLEPQPGSSIAAHTFLMFEFEGNRLLGLTIEARREANEDYSALNGAFNAYELSYVWGSARDLLTRRAVMLNHDVYIYPIAISPEQKFILLRNVLTRTQELETHPRFYNTLFSYCTNELAKATDLSWHYSFILTGKSDEHLYREGYIPGQSFQAAEHAAKFSDFVRELNGVPAQDFDFALLSRLRALTPQPLFARGKPT